MGKWDGKIGGAKRRQAPAPVSTPRAGGRGYGFDPHMMAVLYAGEVPTEIHPGAPLGHQRLHALSRVPYVAPILQRRINQLAEHTKPQRHAYDLGFVVRLGDLKKKMTRAAEKKAAEIEAVLLRGDGTPEGGGFEGVARRLLRDSLTYDQSVAEIIYARGGRPWGLSPLDATAVFRARPKKGDELRGQWTRDPRRPAYVEALDGQVVNEFLPHEIFWGIRRPRTWRYAMGYGFPELEEAATVIADLVNARVYNSVAFTNGVHASTIIALKSSMDPDQFDAFKMQLQQMMTGVRQARRMPVIQMSPGRAGEPKDEIQAVSLTNNNREMEFSAWMSTSMKAVYACFGMDPAENGYLFGNEGQTSTLNARGPTQRIEASKAGGLRPMVRAWSYWINTNVVWRIDEDFVYDCVGLDEIPESERQRLDAEAVKSFKTPNEIRDAHDLKRIDSPVADMILDSTFVNAALQLQQQQDAEARGGAAPDRPGAEGNGLPEGMTGPGQDESGPAVGDGGEVDWNNVDDMTKALVRQGERAIAEGRWLRKARYQRGERVGLVSAHGGRVRHIVEVV